MYGAIDGFLRYLKIERNSSELTLKSYSEDFGSLLDYFRDRVGEVTSPGAIHIGQLRGYVSYLNECDYARTTIARYRDLARNEDCEPESTPGTARR